MNLREFRANTKSAFDKAEAGEEVLIQRNGTTFQLCVHGALPQAALPVTVIKQPKMLIENLGESKSFKLCKHFADPKYCKYATAGKPCK